MKPFDGKCNHCRRKGLRSFECRTKLKETKSAKKAMYPEHELVLYTIIDDKQKQAKQKRKVSFAADVKFKALCTGLWPFMQEA